MGETAVITPPASVEEKEAEKMREYRIIKNVPKAYQVRATRLIGHIKDYTGVSWNAKGEMVVDGKTLPGSNISVLVNDIIRRLDIGQRVRISKRMQAFEKGYLPGWSEEIFIISKKFPTIPVTYASKTSRMKR